MSQKPKHVCYASLYVKTNQLNLIGTWKYLRDMFARVSLRFSVDAVNFSLRLEYCKICFLKVLLNHKMVRFIDRQNPKLSVSLYQRTAKIQVILNQSIPENKILPLSC